MSNGVKAYFRSGGVPGSIIRESKDPVFVSFVERLWELHNSKSADFLLALEDMTDKVLDVLEAFKEHYEGR